MAAAITDVRRIARELAQGPVAPSWTAEGQVSPGQFVNGGGNVFQAIVGGTSGGSQPTWAASGTVVDGGVTWQFFAAGFMIPPISDAEVSAAIDRAANRMSVKAWGTVYNDGQALLAAHMLLLANPQLGAPAGPITSEKVGDLSRNYAAPQLGEMGGYEQTRFGREYRLLMRTLGLSVQVL